MLDTAILVAIVAGVFTVGGRLLDYFIQRQRVKSQNAADEASAVKDQTDAFAKINEVKDELLEMFRQERDECKKEIENVRKRYGEDIERLNGENDKLKKENVRLNERVNLLSDELQRITEPKMRLERKA